MKNEIVKLKTTCEDNHVTGVMVINDYSKIITPEWNRNYVPSGLIQLRKSMAKSGVLTPIILVKVGDKWMVVDGNHRLRVAMERGISVTACIVDVDGTGMTENELMIWLNITPRTWKPADYLNNGVVYHQSEDYIELNELWEDTEFKIPALYALYSYNNSITDNKNAFEKGDWKITTREFGNNVVNHAQELMELMPFYHKTNFIKALAKCMEKKDYSTEHMLKYAKKNKGKIYDSGDVLRGHLGMLHKVYNHLAPQDTQIVFFTE